MDTTTTLRKRMPVSALLDPKIVFATPNIRETLGHLMSAIDNGRAGEDTGAFLAYSFVIKHSANS